MKRKIVIVGAAAALLLVLVGLLVTERDPERAAGPERAARPAADGGTSGGGAPSATVAGRQIPESEAAPSEANAAAAPEEEKEEPKTPEELKAEADEALVESFDTLTDRWMEPSEKGVTMADVDNFVAQFRKLPPDRREECLHRALNLVPDENVMLLAGILMDKSQPREFTELVFNDILNRDEDVKKPILRQVFRDKTHPCWADTAWIFDVTGEKSE